MDQDTGQPDRIPGARYRRVTRKVTRPVTIDGETEYVTEREKTYVALPPRDWRRAVRAGVVAVTIVVVLISLGWTTASVGALLSLTVAAGIAYAAAAVFDLTWIACMGAEWLARYDDEAVRLPRIAGWVALGASMAAVFTHGSLAGSAWSGAVGASISLLAKGLFVVVMKLTTSELSAAQRGWLKARQGKIGAQRALVGVQRDFNRDLAAIAAERAALGLPRDTDRDMSRDTGQDVDSGRHADATVRVAVATARNLIPNATDEQIAEQLAGIGFDVDRDAVRAVSGQRQDSRDADPGPSRAPRDVETRQGHRRSAPVLSVVPEDSDPDEDDHDSVAATVRRCVRDNVTDVDRVLSAARQVHGQDVSRATVRKALNRAGVKAVG